MGQYSSQARVRIWFGLAATITAGIVLSKLMESWIAGLLLSIPVGLAITVRWAKAAMNKNKS
ncbi:MAG: hypothetical protein GXO74_15820 [Calditrichaeota bacterium]|nr:hypothetical protein [Calditrichota bacterium]